MTKENFYTVYLYCTALNKGKYSVVEATSELSAINKALSMSPGYEPWDIKLGNHSDKALKMVGKTLNTQYCS